MYISLSMNQKYAIIEYINYIDQERTEYLIFINLFRKSIILLSKTKSFFHIYFLIKFYAALSHHKILQVKNLNINIKWQLKVVPNLKVIKFCYTLIINKMRLNQSFE